ncbi:MAG: hypothetical protein ACJAWV_000561 [Flammeovirgaceae bacterium]|jgi:hypothetical protein
MLRIDSNLSSFEPQRKGKYMNQKILENIPSSFLLSLFSKISKSF